MGKVVFVDNTVIPTTSTVRTRLEIPNADRSMAPGAYLNVRLKVQELAGAISVPERAIVYQTAAATLWVLDAERKARQKVVRTGPRGGAGIVIVEGIGPDEDIVVEGTQRLFDGAQTFDPKAVPAP
jgi:multidrug efflux pump subunit AcrA (membrane-fusion protein)